MRPSLITSVRTLSLLATFAVLVAVAACGQAGSAGTPEAAAPAPTATESPVSTGTASPIPVATDPVPSAMASPVPGDTGVSATTSQVLALTSEHTDVFYPVFGTVTHDIFAAIEANGPVSGEETEGHFTAGLAEYEATLDYATRVVRGACVIESGTVAVGFVVTLPRHEQYASLSPELQSRWDAYERRVATHEQRHVSIFAGVIDEVTAEIDGLSGQFADCDTMEAETNAVWDAAFERDRALQAGFHRDVARFSDEHRAPLEASIDANEARLDDLNGRLEAWSAESTELGTQIASLDADAAVLVARMDEIETVYPDLVLPEPLFEEYGALSAEAQGLIEARNELASRHGALVEAFNAATDEFNAINTATNELIEDLNWLP